MADLPEMTPVGAADSHVESAGHDGSHLYVKFKKGGAIYRYLDAPADHHGTILSHASPGRYLGENIKGRFKHERVEE